MMEKNHPSDMYITPCKSICQLNAAQNICKGCGRSIEEIRKWPRMTYYERMKVMKRLGYGHRRKRGL